MNDDIAIKVENVSKDFKITHERGATLKSHFVSVLKGKKNKSVEVQHALKDISFEIKKGEFFGIVGRNGSGKSTLLKIIAGIYQPNKGKVVVAGKLVPFIELGVGFNPELTGRENVFLNGALLGFSKEEVEGFYDEVVKFAELEKFMDKKLKNYSSGMQVRLAFSMAIRAKADILLIDEVLAVGDADFQRKCFSYFDELKGSEVTVVFVSHDMNVVRKYCTRAALIDGSKLVNIGETDKIAQEYSKMFASYSTTTSNSMENRWGDGRVKTSKIKLDLNHKEITIKQSLKAFKDVSGVIAGVRIRSASGTHLLGTNTSIEKMKPLELKSNGLIHIEWKIPNILNSGEYSIDPALVYDDGVGVADWWDGAVHFTVNKDKELPYPVSPDIEVEIVKK